MCPLTSLFLQTVIGYAVEIRKIDALITQAIIASRVASLSTQDCPVLQTAMLAGADESLSEVAFQYGRNVGLAFQLVDDLLDFVSSSAAMGKPTAADLKLGLATAPVLFACERVRKLNSYPIHFQKTVNLKST
jgi:geranylgeranyl pyrophosphate synthase